MFTIATNEVWVAHAKEMFVFYLSSVISFFDLFDIQVTYVAGLGLLVVEEDINIFAVIDGRYHEFRRQLWCSAFWIVWILRLTRKIGWSQYIMPDMHG